MKILSVLPAFVLFVTSSISFGFEKQSCESAVEMFARGKLLNSDNCLESGYSNGRGRFFNGCIISGATVTKKDTDNYFVSLQYRGRNDKKSDSWNENSVVTVVRTENGCYAKYSSTATN